MDNRSDPSLPHPWVLAPRPISFKAINIRQVPEPIWSKAREQALAAGLPFKVFMIELLATSSPLPPGQRPSIGSSAGPLKTINVRHVPFDVWLLVRRNALRSGLTVREFVIALLA